MGLGILTNHGESTLTISHRCEIFMGHVNPEQCHWQTYFSENHCAERLLEALSVVLAIGQGLLDPRQEHLLASEGLLDLLDP